MTVTYSSVSISILEDMLLEIASEIISRSILDEKLLRQEYGMAQPGLVEEGETAAGLVKKVRQNIGNSASGSSQSSAAATPQSGESGSIPDIGRIGFLQNGKEIFPRSTNCSDAYFQLVFGNRDDLGCPDNRKRKEQVASAGNLDWRRMAAGPDKRRRKRTPLRDGWSSRSELGHLGCTLLPDTVHGCGAEHAGTRSGFSVFGSFQIQPPPD
ncbi:hypothetical protein KL942_003187 [Ogataea angusta]|uniref:Uncharacterized protein n=1 Tax=Pichia angusta TaxID=870730 RepID=A0ABQ7RVU1_PICAN|nr:hypothetical protein KL942_003187 [Ogataea angusta]KAG7849209.1 hypothetical protein KL940_002891 [Ogataea angusta]